MKKIMVCLLLLAVGLAGPACQVAQLKTAVASEKPRQTSPAVGDSDLATLVSGNTSFASWTRPAGKSRGWEGPHQLSV